MWPYRVYPESSGHHIDPRDTKRRSEAEQRLREHSLQIDCDAGNAKLRLERSQIFQSLQMYDRAIEDLSVAMQLDPERRYFYLFLRHRLHIYSGNLAAALTDILEAFKLETGGHDYARAAAYVYQLLGRTEMAVDVLRQGVEKCPDSPRPHESRAAFYEDIGRFSEAIDDLSKALELSPPGRRLLVLHYRAGIYARAGKFTEALADCNTCISAERREWTHYRLRSEVYEAMGEFAAAKVDYDRSMDLHPMFGGK